MVKKNAAAAAHVNVTPPPVRANWATSFAVVVVTTLSCKWHVVTGDKKGNNNARVFSFA